MSTAPPDPRELLKRALVEIKSLKARVAAAEGQRQSAIAIMGLGCRLPGGVRNPADFWRLLMSGTDPIGPAPAGRLIGGAGLPPGGFLDEVETFDAGFFGISPREAAAMDPQHRLLLEVAWEALEDAAIAPDRLAGTTAGVFIGLATNDFARRALLTEVDRYYGSGTSPAIAAGRIAYALDLKGPCLTLDTACSSSLAALHLAARSLRSGECDLALVGGVSLMLTSELGHSFMAAGMLAPDGRCKSFDAKADGYGRAEGCAVMVLRRLADAVAAGDRVRAILRGTAMGQDGRSAGITAPNGPAQAAVIRAALADAGLAAGGIDMIEAHGTGTPLGDVIEAQALASVFGPGRDRPLVVGAVKSTLGHAEAAAGIAGLAKAVLALEQGRVPPNLHFRKLNPEIRASGLELQIPFSAAPAVQRIGVSSFGFSGTNVHAVLERAPPPPPPKPVAGPPPQLLLSARDEPALRVVIERYRRLFEQGEITFADACHTAAVGRARFERWIEVRDPSELGAATMHQGQPPAPAPSTGRKAGLPTYPFRPDRFRLPGAAAEVAHLGPDDPRLAGTGGLAHLGVLASLLAEPSLRTPLHLAELQFALALRVTQPLELRLERRPPELCLQTRHPGAATWQSHLVARPADPRIPSAPAVLPTGPAWPADELYARIEAAGFVYGSAARCLLTIEHQADGLAIGRLRSGLTLADPGVLEAAAQLLYGLLDDAVGTAPMLTGCARLDIVDWLAPAERVWFRLDPAPAPAAGDGSISGAFGVLASDGRPLAGIEAGRFTPQPSFRTRFGHRVRWDPAPLAPAASPVLSTPPLVLGTSELPWPRVASPDALPAAMAGCPAPVVLYACDAAEPLAAVELLLEILAALAGSDARLVIATRGGQATGHGVEWPAAYGAASLWGAAQAIIAEQPQRRCHLVDLDPTRSFAAQATELALEATAEPAAIAWRASRRYARRLSRLPPAPRGGPVIAQLLAAGAAAELAWRPMPTADPKFEEVEIEVVAAGLTFRDRLVAAGLQTASTPLGADVAGHVRRLGPGVAGLERGQAVVALAEPALADRVIVSAHLVHPSPLPDLLAAAALPLPYATARLGLAEGRDGQSSAGPILVHQAAGATGLAAVELGRAGGREVRVTAASTKHAYLRARGVQRLADSRDPAGWPTLGSVEVAFGAFAGVLPPGLDAARIVDLAGGFDLGACSAAKLGQALDGLAELPPLPTRVVDRADAATAISAIGDGIGRTVVLMRPPPRTTLDRAGAYLVTGAGGAIGAAIGRWLVRQGVAAVYLLDRAPLQPLPPCHAIAGDVADADQLAAVFARIDCGPHPLRGIFHAAAELVDTPLPGVDKAGLERTFRAKVEGARQLDRLTRQRRAGAARLDQFVLLGSIVSLLPSAGQAAYAAANAVLDRIAAERRLLGLAGTCLVLGPVGAGIGQRMGERAHAAWAQHGVGRLELEPLIEALPELLPGAQPLSVVLDIDWARHAEAAAGKAPAAEAALLDVPALQALLAPIVGAADPQALDPETPLLSLGIDSLMAVEFAQAIGRASGRPVPRTFVYAHGSLRAAAAALAADRGPAAGVGGVASSSRPPAEAAPAPATVFAPRWRDLPAVAAQGLAGGWSVLGQGALAERLRRRLPGGEPTGILDLTACEPDVKGATDSRAIRASAIEAVRAAVGRRWHLVWVTPAHDPRAELVDGLVATLRLEQPALAARRIALAMGMEEPLDALLRELGRADPPASVRLMASGATTPLWAPVPVGGDAWRPRADAAYLVTGATGGIGRLLVRHLLDRGAGEVIEVGRRVAASSPTQGQGALRSLAADLTSAAAVEALIEQARQGRLPLRGIFHLAGALADGKLASLSDSALDTAFAAKADAALALDRATRGMTLDHFVLFSSLTGIVGRVGAGAYAAANSLLAGVATARHAAGLPAQAIAWGIWRGTGMAADLDEPAATRLPAYPPAAALASLDRAMACGEPVVAILGDLTTRLLPGMA